MSGATLPTALFLVTLFIRAAAQTSTVVCDPTYSWALNSRGQTPCTVAAYLQQVCLPDKEWAVQPLPPMAHYGGPLKGQDTKCQCNSVVYQLLSACADCQGGTVTKWSTWIRNCSNVYPNGYPEEVPAGTSVPAWAHLSISQSDRFERSTAQARANAATLSDAAKSTPTPGEIAGIVIASIFVLGLTFVVIWYIRHRAHLPAPTSEPVLPAYIRFPNPAKSTPSMPDLKGSEPAIPMTPVKGSPKLYDPSDPTTWPPPAFSKLYAPASGGSYTGMPEL